MTLQKSPEAFRLPGNALNHAERPAGEGLNFAVTGEIINALVHKLEASVPRKHRRKPRLDNGRILETGHALQLIMAIYRLTITLYKSYNRLTITQSQTNYMLTL